MIPDAHCHLDQLADPVAAAMEAAGCGVGPILAVSIDAASAETVLRLRDRLPDLVIAGIGLHPSVIAEITPEDQEQQLRRLEGFLGCAGFIGEIGLDYKDARDERTRARQLEALSRQLAWAEARRLPVNLHSRRADRAVLNAAIDFHARTDLPALMHWFTHSQKLARLCAERGIYISAGPSVLVDPRTAETIGAIDDSILLVETDSPVEYGQEGAARPAWAARVLSRLAEIRGVTAEALARTVRLNLGRYLAARPAPGT